VGTDEFRACRSTACQLQETHQWQPPEAEEKALVYLNLFLHS